MIIKSIAIEITNNAFLPEAYAYHEYFLNKGFKCDLIYKGKKEMLSYDAVFLFHGFHPFWRKYPKYIIGEYHTLSTGEFSRFKDLVKRVFNITPNLYVFLNEEIRRKLWFSSKVNYVIRGMGFSSKEFDAYSDIKKKYDVVYAGSYREGVVNIIENLAYLGLKLCVVGFDYNFTSKNVTCYGIKNLSESRKIIAQSKLGLNYTPDVFPFNVQDSTKVIEYCGAGLGVITNKYKWINDFERDRGASFLNLDLASNIEIVENYNYIVPDVSDLNWPILIDKIYKKLI